MTDKCNESVREWLRDIYAIELCSEHLFSKCLDKFEGYPDVYVQMEAAVQSFVENQTRLSIRMQQLGTNYSTIKNIGTELLGGTPGFSVMAIEDIAVKTILKLHSHILLTIGPYKIVIAAAQVNGDQETELLFHSFLQQAESRAEWLEKLLIPFTKNYLIRKK